MRERCGAAGMRMTIKLLFLFYFLAVEIMHTGSLLVALKKDNMKVAALLLLFTIWAFEKVAAAAAPAAFVTSETPVATTAVVPPFQMHHKPTLLQKLEWKLLQ